MNTKSQRHILSDYLWGAAQEIAKKIEKKQGNIIQSDYLG
jgi:hypothetical protein